MKHIKRALKGNASMWNKFQSKVESIMDREPMVTYKQFCDAIMRKHEQLEAEATQEAALNTETSQANLHSSNEDETAMYTNGKGGGKGRGKGGRGRGRGRHLDRNQYNSDARVGALYHAQGAKGNEQIEASNPFWRGGGCHSGGKGYDFNSYYGKGKGGQGGRGGGKGKSKGKGDVKFDGYCDKCNNYGHKEADCYAKRQRL